MQRIEYTLWDPILITLADPERDIAMVLCLAPPPCNEARRDQAAGGIATGHHERGEELEDFVGGVNLGRGREDCQ